MDAWDDSRGPFPHWQRTTRPSPRTPKRTNVSSVTSARSHTRAKPISDAYRPNRSGQRAYPIWSTPLFLDLRLACSSAPIRGRRAGRMPDVARKAIRPGAVWSRDAAPEYQTGTSMKRKIFGSAAVLAGIAALFFVPMGSAQAVGANCDDVRDGDYIQYSWPDSDSSFTFLCQDGKWVFVG